MSPPAAKFRPDELFLIALSFLTGFSMMLVELTATRLLAPYFGSSVYTWTNVIGAILAALAIGYHLGGKLADRRPSMSTALWLVFTSGLLTALVPVAAPAISNLLLPASGAGAFAIPLFLRASLFVSLVVFAPPVFVMALLSPVIVRLLTRNEPVGWASGVNSASATTGALLGTFAPTLWLVPTIGSRRTILLAATLQLGMALAGFLRNRLRGGAVATSLMLVATIGQTAATGAPLRAAEGLVEDRETQYQYAQVIRDGSETLLRLEEQTTGSQSMRFDNSHLTGGTIYDYLMLLPFLSGADTGAPLDILILGAGAGTSCEQYSHFFGPTRPVRIDAVEIDPALFDIGRSHFGLGNLSSDVTLIAADGRSFLATSGKRYDVIVIDVFQHHFFVPWYMVTTEFFTSVRDHLKPGGVVGMNVLVSGSPSEFLDGLEATVASVFGSTWQLRLPHSFNVALFATPGGDFDLLAAGRRLEAYPPAGTPISEASELRDLLSRGLAAASRWSTESGAEPFTDDRAPVERLMLRDIRRLWEDK